MQTADATQRCKHSYCSLGTNDWQPSLSITLCRTTGSRSADQHTAAASGGAPAGKPGLRPSPSQRRGRALLPLLTPALHQPTSPHVQDDALLQAVGTRPYPHTPGLATAFELYQQQPGGVAVAQQRAPAAPGTQAAFAERLAAFVKQSGVKEVRDGALSGCAHIPAASACQA